MAVRDRIRRASFHAITAKNAARVIYVVDGSVTFARGNSVGVCIFCSLDINTIRRTRRGAQKASDALLQPVFIAMQHVNAPIARLKMYGLVRIVLRHRLSEHVLEGDTEAFHHRGERREYFADRICHGGEFSRAATGGQTSPAMPSLLQRVDNLLPMETPILNKNFARMPPANHHAGQMQSGHIAL